MDRLQSQSSPNSHSSCEQANPFSIEADGKGHTMSEMNDQVGFLGRPGKFADDLEFCVKNNDGNLRFECQQDKFRESNQLTDNNENSSTVCSAENVTFNLSPASLLKLKQQGNPLGVSASSFSNGIATYDTDSKEEDIGNGSTESFVSEPKYESEVLASQFDNIESNINDHEAFVSSLSDKTELENITSYKYSAGDEYGSVNGASNSNTPHSNAETELIEGSENPSFVNTPDTTGNIGNWSFIYKRDSDVNIIENSEEPKTQIFPEIGSIDCCTRSENFSNTKFLDPVNDTEEVAGPSSAIARPQWRIEDGQFICMECGKKFNYEILVVVHCKTHVKDKRLPVHKFTCVTCGKRFHLERNLTSHLRNHNVDKAYSCDECDYQSKWKNNLNRHRLTHTGEKPFSCDKCEYKCNQQYSLKLHSLTHTGK